MNYACLGLILVTSSLCTAMNYSTHCIEKINFIENPLFVVIPHKNIIASANEKKCALYNRITKNSSTIVDNTLIFHLIKHPQEPTIALSTAGELILFDIDDNNSRKKWSIPPLAPSAATAFNTTHNTLIAYHAGELTIYNTINGNLQQKTQIYTRTIYEEFYPISCHPKKNHLTYFYTYNALGRVDLANPTATARPYIKPKDSFIMRDHIYNNDGTLIATTDDFYGCEIYKTDSPLTEPFSADAMPWCMRFHPERKILAVLDTLMTLNYYHTDSHKLIARTHPLIPKYRHNASLQTAEYISKMDFSPDGEQSVIIADGTLLLHNTLPNNIIAIYTLLKSKNMPNLLIKLILIKLARCLTRYNGLLKLHLLQLSQT